MAQDIWLQYGSSNLADRLANWPRQVMKCKGETFTNQILWRKNNMAQDMAPIWRKNNMALGYGAEWRHRAILYGADMALIWR